MITHIFKVQFINIKVNDFCEYATGEHHAHNWFAPTKQNLMCYGQSAWEIINQSEDFQNLAPMKNATPPETKFTILRPGNITRYVLVLDRSKSMLDPKNDPNVCPRIDRLKEASIKFVMYDVEDGDSMGVVSFR